MALQPCSRTSINESLELKINLKTIVRTDMIYSTYLLLTEKSFLVKLIPAGNILGHFTWFCVNIQRFKDKKTLMGILGQKFWGITENTFVC